MSQVLQERFRAVAFFLMMMASCALLIGGLAYALAPDGETIQLVEVEVEAPEVGSRPVQDADVRWVYPTDVGDGVEVGSVVWEGSFDQEQRFEADHAYNAIITLESDSFDRKVEVVVNGRSARFELLEDNGTELVADAVFDLSDHTVHFDGNGVPGKMGDMVIDSQGAELEACAFESDEDVLSHWNTKRDGSGRSFCDRAWVCPEDDLTLYAQWVAQGSSAITYDANFDTSECLLEHSLVDARSRVSLSSLVPSRTGYLFEGWNTERDGTGDDFLPGQWARVSDAGLLLYAQWGRDEGTVRVSFDPNGGEGDMDEVCVLEGEGVTLPECEVVRPGYSFGGWSLTADGECRYADGEEIAQVDTNLVLYATWEATGDARDTYKLKFSPNAGDVTGKMGAVETTDGETVRLPECNYERDGFDFEGWSTASDEDATIDDKGTVTIEENMTLFAQWASDEDEDDYIDDSDDEWAYEQEPATASTHAHETYKVSFVANGGAGTMSELTLDEGTSKALPHNTFTRTGHVFEGWDTKPDGTGIPYDDTEVVDADEDLVLYAQWSTTHTISYDANGGVGTMPRQSFDGEEISVSKNTFTRSGHKFEGWNTEPDGSGVPYDEDEEIYDLDEDLVLYAQWDGDTSSSNSSTSTRSGTTSGTTSGNSSGSHTIRFEANGGQGTMSSVTAHGDEEVILPDSSFRRSGYVFDDYNTKADGSGIPYFEGEEVVTDEDMTLYAQWVARDGSATSSIDAGEDEDYDDVEDYDDEEEGEYGSPSAARAGSNPMQGAGGNTPTSAGGASFSSGRSGNGRGLVATADSTDSGIVLAALSLGSSLGILGLFCRRRVARGK